MKRQHRHAPELRSLAAIAELNNPRGLVVFVAPTGGQMVNASLKTHLGAAPSSQTTDDARQQREQAFVS